ncbi:MAG: hypothetical protein PCFJNLEI_02617 [Verrucomicrobiae bacterium]|nr:hypothetical protein [Verrucomicrobiae bacterium]
MKVASKKFLTWLMSLTTLMRYFVIAVMFHVLILFILGTIEIAGAIPKIIATFSGAMPPPPVQDDMDPFAALRDFEYSGPTLGGGGGTPGKGPGGIPTAAGTTPTEYKASISAVDRTAVDSQVQEVIGVVSDSATAVARLQGSGLGGVAAPTMGFGEGKIGTAGVRGPGGGGFGHRVGPMRAQKIKQGGGSGDTERAVLAALRWLKEQQTKDGSWAGYSKEASSALATLCFLGHGETPDSEEFGPTVSRALSYLVTVVGSDGIVKSKSMYAQGAVLLALAEAYGMTQSPLVREPLDRAVNAVVQSQKVKKTKPADQGGWRYSPLSADADTSVTGWLVMGLKSAKLANISVPDEAFEKASEYLWNMHAENGGFGYSNPGHGYATTAIGILCQQFLGHHADRRLKKSLDLYKDKKVDWDKPPGNHGTPFYPWYYITQAMFQAGGSYWTQWNTEMRKVLVAKQASDGHWDPPGEKNPYGPVYSTALACLMLEVYYRYLPIYQEMEKKNLPAMPVATPGRPTGSS